MRKLFALIAVLGMLTIGASSMLMAQENETTQTETTETYQEEEETTDPTVLEDESQIKYFFPRCLETKIHRGGAAFMSFVILCLIFGLAIAIERVIYLNLASTNTKKLIVSVEDALNNGGVEAAKKFAVTQEAPLQVFSIKDYAAMIKGLTWLKNQLYHTVLFKWDFWKKECLGLVCLLD